MVTVAVLGAAGGTGREVVAALVAQGDTARAVVRDPAKHAAAFAAPAFTAGPGLVEVVAGDVTDEASLAAALAGCDGGAVFAAQGAPPRRPLGAGCAGLQRGGRSRPSHKLLPRSEPALASALPTRRPPATRRPRGRPAAGSGYWSANKVDRDGVAAAAAAAAAAGAGPLVLVSSALVTPKNRRHPIRVMLNTLRWGLMDAKYAGESALRVSGLAYTIVRPGRLADGAPGGAIEAAQGDSGAAGLVTRAGVAAVCVAALRDPAARGVTLELLEARGGEGGAAPPLAEQMRGFFAGLKRDSEA
jgi:uncharacterized protein YbjT (DUF2867 family)